MNPPDRMAIYRVSRNGHVMGEFDIDRIVELLDSGEFMWTDLWRHESTPAWRPLTELRSEVAAAKAFPPFVAAPVAAVAGRRSAVRPAAGPAQTRAASAGMPGWGWVLSGVSLGAVVGLLVTHFFPIVVQVDRPVDRIVEKVVEKPVEIVRVVEKRVDAPAVLTPAQSAAVVFSRRLFDADEQRPGVSPYKLSDKVKVVGNFEGEGASHLAAGVILARVETAFRRQGFTTLPADSEDHPFTTVKVGGVFLENKFSDGSLVGISGSYELVILQPLVCFSPFTKSSPELRLIMRGDVKVYENAGTLRYGVSNFIKVHDVYEQLAEEASNELRKAQGN
jgi:hypothetical protein